jgi:hypothetical protein
VAERTPYRLQPNSEVAQQVGGRWATSKVRVQTILAKTKPQQFAKLMKRLETATRQG